MSVYLFFHVRICIFMHVCMRVCKEKRHVCVCVIGCEVGSRGVEENKAEKRSL